GGVVTGSGQEIGGIAVQPDAKIVVAGTTAGESFLLARYLADGTLDPSFGDGGYVETQVGEWGFASAIALQPDGKIVVGGGSYQGDYQGATQVSDEFSLARYNSNGSLDSSFGTGGITNTVIPESVDDYCFPSEGAAADSLALVPGGDILAGGSSGWTDGCSKFDSSGFALAGYKPDGSLDPTFGDGGITQTSEPGVGVALAVQPDGEVVAAEGNHMDRYAPNGSLNLSFDPDPNVRHFGALALQD